MALFLLLGGTVCCEITDNQRCYSSGGLEIPCKFVLQGDTKRARHKIRGQSTETNTTVSKEQEYLNKPAMLNKLIRNERLELMALF